MADIVSDLPSTDSIDTATFPRLARLRNPQQFQDTFSQGRRINAPLFRLHVRFAPVQRGCTGSSADVDVARLGIAVSKRVDARAVGRNRIKRVARGSFRAIRARLPAGDYVLLAQRQAADVDNAQLAQALDALWARATALGTAALADVATIEAAAGEVPLKLGSAAVTMPPRDAPVAVPGRTPELP